MGGLRSRTTRRADPHIPDSQKRSSRIRRVFSRWSFSGNHGSSRVALLDWASHNTGSNRYGTIGVLSAFQAAPRNTIIAESSIHTIRPITAARAPYVSPNCILRT